jgi:hypothetical protein
MDIPNCRNIENQEQQLAYLSEVHPAEQSIGGNHEPIVEHTSEIITTPYSTRPTSMQYRRSAMARGSDEVSRVQ